MTRYVVDASVVIKWFIPEIYAESAGFLQNSSYQLHAPAFFVLEVGNALCKKIRRQELIKKEGVPKVPLRGVRPKEQSERCPLFQTSRAEW